MRTPLLWIALCILPTAPETFNEATVDKKLSTIWPRLVSLDLRVEEGHDIIYDKVVGVLEQVETLKNATAQLLEELSIVRSRQAASSAVQVFMALAFLAYLATIAVCYLVKRCKKHQKEVAKAEFERLEMQLRSSKARRRAAAAQEKSAQAHSLE